MRAMFEFVCESCGVFERYIDSKAEMDICDCGKPSHRIISTPQVKLDGTSDAFPGAHMRWAKIREDNARIKAKREH